MQRDLQPVYRFPLLIMAMFALAIGTLAGLGRLGIAVPDLALQQIGLHGVLMIPVFFGTVISLERAVALKQRWAYLAPLCNAMAGITLLTGMPLSLGVGLLSAGGLLLLVASTAVLLIQNQTHNWILLGGALALLTGNLLLQMALSADSVLLWWIAFLVLTIAGERLELSRMVNHSPQRRRQLVWLSLLPLLGAAVASVSHSTGIVITALGLGGIGYWLLRHDIARRTMRLDGLARFTAICMLLGYGWLILSSLHFLAWSTDLAPLRDAALHTLFLGFVFSMVIGHALLIFPAVTRLKIPYSPLFYLPLILLQCSLALRVGATWMQRGDLLQLAALHNAITLLVFVLCIIFSATRGYRQQHSIGPKPGRGNQRPGAEYGPTTPF